MNQEEKPKKKGWKYKIKPLAEKKRAVELFRKGEMPLADIAKQFGVTTSTITQQWVKQVDRGVDRLVGGYKMPTDKHRLKVVREVLSGALTVEQAAEKYDIVEPQTIVKWIQRFNSNLQIAQQSSHESMSPISKKLGRPKKPVEDVQQPVEDELKDAKLKILALETMITLAEEQFKIDIRKKSGTKQSE